MVTTDTLRISLLQTDLKWHQKQLNLKEVAQKIKLLKGESDLLVLPEMFSTGFTTNTTLAEEINGTTMQFLQAEADRNRIAIAGTFICVEKKKFYNRAFFIAPDVPPVFYNKRHLFRMGAVEESSVLSTDCKPEKSLFTYKGWNIRMIVCYDLRFPVWNRNVNNEYDLLICMASWPTSRIKVWDTLLMARAIENQCFVAACNRVGADGNEVGYNGHSQVIHPKGMLLADCREEACIETVTISKAELERFRTKFPVWKDADDFGFLSAPIIHCR